MTRFESSVPQYCYTLSGILKTYKNGGKFVLEISYKNESVKVGQYKYDDKWHKFEFDKETEAQNKVEELLHT